MELILCGQKDIEPTDIDDIHLCLSVPEVDHLQPYRFRDAEMEPVDTSCG